MPLSRIDRLLASLSHDWINRQKAFSTKAAVDYLQGLAKTVAEVKNIHDADIRSIIDMEILTLKHEKELYGAEDPTIIPSLDSAIKSLMLDAKGAISTAENPDDYGKAALTHSSKHKQHGIPIDGFHETINSHITRLDNRIRTVGVPIPEKTSLIARKENMKYVKQLYIAMQKKAFAE
jgi:hypothetical protein